MSIERFLIFFLFALSAQGRILFVTAKNDGVWREKRLWGRKLAERSTSEDKGLAKARLRLKLMKVAKSIRKNAKKERMNVKRLKVGKNVRKLFQNENVAKDLARFLADPKLDSRIHKAEEKIEALSPKPDPASKPKKRKARKLGVRHIESNPVIPNEVLPPRAMPQMQYMPGVAGAPFPSYFMNGPHHHPPMKITVNSLPNPNPRAALNPFEVQHIGLQKQVRELTGISAQLDKLGSELRMMDNEMEASLDDNYNRVLQLD